VRPLEGKAGVDVGLDTDENGRIRGVEAGAKVFVGSEGDINLGSAR
jgi:hypothetical protein